MNAAQINRQRKNVKNHHTMKLNCARTNELAVNETFELTKNHNFFYAFVNYDFHKKNNNNIVSLLLNDVKEHIANNNKKNCGNRIKNKENNEVINERIKSNGIFYHDFSSTGN